MTTEIPYLLVVGSCFIGVALIFIDVLVFCCVVLLWCLLLVFEMRPDCYDGDISPLVPLSYVWCLFCLVLLWCFFWCSVGFCSWCYLVFLLLVFEISSLKNHATALMET